MLFKGHQYPFNGSSAPAQDSQVLTDSSLAMPGSFGQVYLSGPWVLFNGHLYPFSGSGESCPALALLFGNDSNMAFFFRRRYMEPFGNSGALELVRPSGFPVALESR
ncbi:hypothetical protein ES705_32222 [subsurface metagenome]